MVVFPAVTSGSNKVFASVEGGTYLCSCDDDSIGIQLHSSLQSNSGVDYGPSDEDNDDLLKVLYPQPFLPESWLFLVVSVKVPGTILSTLVLFHVTRQLIS